MRPPAGLKLISGFMGPLANSATMGTQTEHCQWEDETASKRTGHQPSYAEAKKVTSLIIIPMIALGPA